MRHGFLRWMGVVVMAVVLAGSGVLAAMAQAPADALKEANTLLRVYELSVLTPQGGPDRTEKAPPFGDYWVGESWNMRLDNVPAMK